MYGNSLRNNSKFKNTALKKPGKQYRDAVRNPRFKEEVWCPAVGEVDDEIFFEFDETLDFIREEEEDEEPAATPTGTWEITSKQRFENRKNPVTVG